MGNGDKKDKKSKIVTIKAPKKLGKYLAHKGSVTVNGVSLTLVNPRINSAIFNVSLVTYTLDHTNLSKLKIGSMVNVEVDLLARYLERLKG